MTTNVKDILYLIIEKNKNRAYLLYSTKQDISAVPHMYSFVFNKLKEFPNDDDECYCIENFQCSSFGSDNLKNAIANGFNDSTRVVLQNYDDVINLFKLTTTNNKKQEYTNIPVAANFFAQDEKDAFAKLRTLVIKLFTLKGSRGKQYNKTNTINNINAKNLSNFKDIFNLVFNSLVVWERDDDSIRKNNMRDKFNDSFIANFDNIGDLITTAFNDNININEYYQLGNNDSDIVLKNISDIEYCADFFDGSEYLFFAYTTTHLYYILNNKYYKKNNSKFAIDYFEKYYMTKETLKTIKNRGHCCLNTSYNITEDYYTCCKVLKEPNTESVKSYFKNKENNFDNFLSKVLNEKAGSNNIYSCLLYQYHSNIDNFLPIKNNFVEENIVLVDCTNKDNFHKKMVEPLKCLTYNNANIKKFFDGYINFFYNNTMNLKNYFKQKNTDDDYMQLLYDSYNFYAGAINSKVVSVPTDIFNAMLNIGSAGVGMVSGAIGKELHGISDEAKRQALLGLTYGTRLKGKEIIRAIKKQAKKLGNPWGVEGPDPDDSDDEDSQKMSTAKKIAIGLASAATLGGIAYYLSDDDKPTYKYSINKNVKFRSRNKVYYKFGKPKRRSRVSKRKKNKRGSKKRA